MHNHFKLKCSVLYHKSHYKNHPVQFLSTLAVLFITILITNIISILIELVSYFETIIDCLV